MKLATWNVNSIRARRERVLGWLAERAPDVVCLQETKVQDDLFPTDEVRALGYEVALHGQKTYNGVAILSRTPMADVERGFGDGDEQARLVAATIGGVRVVSVYVPNGQAPGSEKYAYKLAWLGRLRAYLATAGARERPLVLCGDFNVAPDDRDVHDPAAWVGQILCTDDERRALAEVVGVGLHDAFRQLEAGGGFFTWWDYRQLGFAKNRGLRIDHIYLSEPVVARLESVTVDREARKGKQPSDHAPVIATLRD